MKRGLVIVSNFSLDIVIYSRDVIVSWFQFQYFSMRLLCLLAWFEWLVTRFIFQIYFRFYMNIVKVLAYYSAVIDWMWWMDWTYDKAHECRKKKKRFMDKNW